MVSVALVCLVVGLVAGFVIGHLWTRSRAALSALARAQVEAAAARADVARGGAAHDLAERQYAIEALVAPLQHALDEVTSQLHVVERDRLRAGAALEEQLAAVRSSADGLRTETSQLVTALRAPQVRGRWGELQLERAVEAAGLVEHVDYRTQVSVTGEDGMVRPDLVVTLVGGRDIVIDAKVAFAAYLEAMEASTETRRAERLRAHARQLRNHVDSLAAKTYWSAFESTPEFVVCFVPAEAFLDAALREDPDLLEHALSHNVVIATPSTLVALLRTIGYSWRQESLARNTAEISKLGRELHQRLSVMVGHLDKLGRSLSTAVGAFNSTVGTFEGRVLVTARRFADLSVVDNGVQQGLAPPEQILATSRAVSPE